MKRTTTLLFFLSSIFYLAAQPVNDDCGGIIDLGVAPICPSPAIYTNVDATETNVGNDNYPPCFNGPPNRDVWFSFVATSTFLDYTITVTGAGATPILMPQLAFYRGECLTDELVLLDCVTSALGENEVSLSVAGLTPGITYFLRINDWSVSAAPNWGTFELCIEEDVTVTFTVDEGSSNLCAGELYDTGGSGGPYGNNENHVFTICPTEPHECLIFTLQQYNIQNGGEQLIFYDGVNTSAPVIATITGGANGGNQGGVCYPVVATSGCMSVQFISNGILAFDGFHGTWQCTNDCPEPATLDLQVTPQVAVIGQAMENPLMDITVTNINCPDEAFAVFQEGDNTNLGMDKGLLLTTGKALDVNNPASFLASTNWNLGGDPEMDFLNQQFGNGLNTADACVLEADVFVKTDRISFDYVFGSDEYKQQFSNFSNDLIGVMVSGPGITGLPGLNGQENLAFLPSTNTLIQIQTVNASTNWQYFRNNLNNQTIAYNGLTSSFLGEPKTLTAQRQVTPCQTYHVKIAIADTDENDDSGLFIAAAQTGLPQMNVNFQTGIDYLVEGCVNVASTINVNLPEAATGLTSFDVEVGGTATLGVDYLLTMPSIITFPVGETQLAFQITPLTDALAEGTETIVVTLKKDYGCGVVTVATLTMELKDELEVNILPDQPIIFVCQSIGTAALQATGAASYSWSPAGIFDNPNSANPTATISSNQTVTVTGTLGTCTATDQVSLQLISPQVNITAAGGTQLCQGESVQLTATNNVNNSGLTWSPTTGLSDPDSNVTMAQPPFTTTYTATVSASGCTASDDITLTVEPFSFPQGIANDTTICQNSSVQLAGTAANTGTTFVWSPGTGLNNPNIPNAIATPDQTTTYTLTATSPNGLCTETESVTVTVLPADVDILPDSLEICLGETVQIHANTSTGGPGLTWSPTDSLTTVDAETVAVNPSVSTWYVGTLAVGNCLVKDSVFVRVDSLPVLDIEAIPAKESYCQGEIISLISPNYPFQNYPDIEHQWSPLIGVISEDSLFNLVINATTTTTYIRTTTNHACSSMDSITVVVVPVAEITVTPSMPVICGGESVQLQVTSNEPIDEWEWSPSNGLSCTDCTNPTATPPGTITYQVQGDFEGCPSFGTVTVEVLPAPIFQFPSDRHNCIGESTTLNLVADPLAGYVWTLENGTVFSTEAQPVVSPAQTTTYTLTIDNGQCEPIMQDITIEVTQDYELILNNMNDTICQGSQVVLSAEAPLAGTYDWSPEGTNNQPVTVNANTIYTVEFTDSHQCFTKTASFEVTVSPPFSLDSLIAMPSPVFEGDTLELEAFTIPALLSNPNYTWLTNGEEIGTTSEPFFKTIAPQVDDSLAVIYKVVILDEFGCMGMSSDTVQVKNSAFDMPNVFTPNGDNHNDRFLPVMSENVDILDFKIWNRWGKIVYNNEDGDSGWDGYFKGEPSPSDVYIFYLRYTLGAEETVLKGDVTLLR